MTLTLHSTLHFGPNAVKAILKIASHLDFQKHRCEGEVNQTLREWRKEENAQLLNKYLGIRVQNWFSVDGNTARKFFQNATKVAELLQIPAFVIEDLGTIWTTLCSGEPIDSDKFGSFCDKFIVKFKKHPHVNFYQWSPTLHKGQN